MKQNGHRPGNANKTPAFVARAERALRRAARNVQIQNRALGLPVIVWQNGKIVEKVWKTDGLYGQALTKVVFWLEKAQAVAENPKQAAVIAKLIEFYRTGSLKTYDDYAILWVQWPSAGFGTP